MKQNAERLLVFGFVGTMLFFALLFFILPHHRFSELENRYLQAAPHLSWDDVVSKKYAEEAERFVTDHFPFRDKWLWLKSATEKGRLQQENNDIYQGKDGYLFDKFTKPDNTKVQQDINVVKQFTYKHPKVNMTFLLAPTSIGLYPERLPLLAPAYPQKKVNQLIEEQLHNDLTFINGFVFLEPHASETIYYRTDHHWTTYGAYLAYVAYAKQMGWEPLSQSDFLIKNVSNSFLGSYHTRSQFTNVTPDQIQAYIPRKQAKTEMYIADSNQTFTTMYDTSFLKKKDQYSYFLGGVHALLKLTTKLDPQQIEQQKLLVIKDSYAHNVIPFLTNHIPEIHVIDLRYYNGNITQYMTENSIEDVLFLFNTTTFIEDTTISKINK
ncbi:MULTISPECIES: DHHW family protein [unclassified Lysinibacillus]|uniref:DHHW family protein n=1 Tax=unclassified Lysinibacillus TaxID=2636778 RepID=UPI00380C3775